MNEFELDPTANTIPRTGAVRSGLRAAASAGLQATGVLAKISGGVVVGAVRSSGITGEGDKLAQMAAEAKLVEGLKDKAQNPLAKIGTAVLEGALNLKNKVIKPPHEEHRSLKEVGELAKNPLKFDRLKGQYGKNKDEAQSTRRMVDTVLNDGTVLGRGVTNEAVGQTKDVKNPVTGQKSQETQVEIKPVNYNPQDVDGKSQQDMESQGQEAVIGKIAPESVVAIQQSTLGKAG